MVGAALNHTVVVIMFFQLQAWGYTVANTQRLDTGRYQEASELCKLDYRLFCDSAAQRRVCEFLHVPGSLDFASIYS